MRPTATSDAARNPKPWWMDIVRRTAAPTPTSRNVATVSTPRQGIPRSRRVGSTVVDGLIMDPPGGRPAPADRLGKRLVLSTVRDPLDRRVPDHHQVEPRFQRCVEDLRGAVHDRLTRTVERGVSSAGHPVSRWRGEEQPLNRG